MRNHVKQKGEQPAQPPPPAKTAAAGGLSMRRLSTGAALCVLGAQHAAAAAPTLRRGVGGVLLGVPLAPERGEQATARAVQEALE
eukprot:CAMPEP_0118814752 /NCGR_PEP_ID=MMETSP1162-20130426/3755_1 /TAXON_ID=33656 /ORGANISM="Phaeocystis Sp, Strain CCMP2710" /LENGTH=84 /DNA_ID=CAMNT_0006744663 /DNA_START=114 /DNA_END=364 /DNA_ORIENTATION=+